MVLFVVFVSFVILFLISTNLIYPKTWQKSCKMPLTYSSKPSFVT